MLIKSIAQDSRIEQSFLKEYCLIHEAQTGLFDSSDCCLVAICAVFTNTGPVFLEKTIYWVLIH